MKRHPQLVPISKVHHQLLILAQLLKKDVPDYKGLPSDLSEKVAYAISVYKKDMIPYLKQMGKELYPKLYELSFSRMDLLEHALNEDKNLMQLFQELVVASAPVTTDFLDHIGKNLELMVRMKERKLFQAIQEEFNLDSIELIHNQES